MRMHVADEDAASKVDAIVAELSGDLNREHVYAAGRRSFGFTAVGISQRGGNDAGFQRFFISADGRLLTEVESYQMKRTRRVVADERCQMSHIR